MTAIPTNIEGLDDQQLTSTFGYNKEVNRTAIYDEAGETIVVFDATLTESVSMSSTLSRHPSEEGVKFSDNQTIEPIEITLSVVISNNPIEQLTLEDMTSKAATIGAGLAGGLVGALADDEDQVTVNQETGEVSFLQNDSVFSQQRGAAVGELLASLAFTLGDNDNSRRDSMAFDALRKSQLNSTRLLIVTPFLSYSNMILKNISFDKTSATTNSLETDLVFEERPTFTTDKKELKPVGKTKGINDAQQKKEKQGKKQAKDATAQQKAKVERPESAAHALGKALGVF